MTSMISNCGDFTLEICNKSTSKLASAGGYIFSALEAIKNDGQALVQLMKTGRYVIAVMRTWRGESHGLSNLDSDLEKFVGLFEGVQFVSAISSLNQKTDSSDESESPAVSASLIERITSAAFILSDLATGCLWLMAKKVPVFGPFSTSVNLAARLDLFASFTALAGTVSDGALAFKTFRSLSGDKNSAMLQLAERVTGAVSLILILPGISELTGAPLAAGAAALSAGFGVVRFLYNWHTARSG